MGEIIIEVFGQRSELLQKRLFLQNLNEHDKKLQPLQEGRYKNNTSIKLYKSIEKVFWGLRFGALSMVHVLDFTILVISIAQYSIKLG